jgi:Ca-activated chloride channel family protein
MMSVATWFENIELLYQGWLWGWPVLISVTLILKQLSGNRITIVAKEALLTSSSQQYVRVIHPLVSLFSKQKSGTARWNWTMMFAVWIILFLLALALSQPVRIGKKIPDTPQERDIVFILDTSVSMLLRDYVFEDQRVDRMTLLKGLLDEFVQQLDGERIAVVIFGDSAYTYIPLTRDHNFIRKMLSRIQTTMAGRFSAVGEAIALAVKQASQKPDRKRILVLFTAANQTTGKIAPLAAAALAREANLPLYTVAIGAGSYQAEEKDRRGGLIYHPVDHQLLQQLASQTGARSYQGSDPSALKRAIADIDQRETNKAEVVPRYFREPLYQWPLSLALIILSLFPLKRLIKAASND